LTVKRNEGNVKVALTVAVIALLLGLLVLVFVVLSQPEHIDRTVHEPITVKIGTAVVVEKLVKVPIEPREFASFQELKDWLEQDRTDAILVFFVSPELPKRHPESICGDFAYHLQRNALADGYLMSTEIVLKEGAWHMINSTPIGNIIYFIEPQTDEVWHGAYR